jgi:hypothetical protein
MNGSVKFRWGLAICVLGGSLVGCSMSSSGTVAVTGKVTKGGQAVSGAAVTFEPTAADGKAASGTTDDTGTYKLTTFVNGDGALPGSYKIKVTKFPGAAATPGIDAGKEPTAADMDAIYKAAEKQGQDLSGRDSQAATVVTNELGARFANAESSGLTAEVKSDGDNKFDFDVTEK